MWAKLDGIVLQTHFLLLFLMAGAWNVSRWLKRRIFIHVNIIPSVRWLNSAEMNTMIISTFFMSGLWVVRRTKHVVLYTVCCSLVSFFTSNVAHLSQLLNVSYMSLQTQFLVVSTCCLVCTWVWFVHLGTVQAPSITLGAWTVPGWTN